MRDLPTHSPRSFPWLELALKPCHKIMHALRMTSGKRLRLPNVSARGTKPAPTAAAQGGFLLSLGRMQPNLSKVRHRVGTQLGCGGFGALVPTTASLEAEPRDELSSVERAGIDLGWHGRRDCQGQWFSRAPAVPQRPGRA